MPSDRSPRSSSLRGPSEITPTPSARIPSATPDFSARCWIEASSLHRHNLRPPLSLRRTLLLTLTLRWPRHTNRCKPFQLILRFNLAEGEYRNERGYRTSGGSSRWGGRAADPTRVNHDLYHGGPCGVSGLVR